VQGREEKHCTPGVQVMFSRQVPPRAIFGWQVPGQELVRVALQ
jgi:transposase